MWTTLLTLALTAHPDAGTPASLDQLERELKIATTAALKEAKDRSSKAQYDKAAEVLEKVIGEFAPRLKGWSEDDLGRVHLYAPLKREGEVAAIYRQRGKLAARASADRASARDLVLSLVEGRGRSDLDLTTFADPRVQELLASLRKLDPGAKALFAPRKVKVVIDSPLKDTLTRKYSEELVTSLRSLGLEASTDTGDEELKVKASEGAVVNAANSFGGGVPADTISCELVATGTWTAKGKVEMAALDLGRRGVGFSDIPDSCLKPRLTESAANAPLAVFRAWAAR